jgi:hypothetical protein
MKMLTQIVAIMGASPGAKFPQSSECYKPLSKGLLWIWGSGPEYFQTTIHILSTCYLEAQVYIKEKEKL